MLLYLGMKMLFDFDYVFSQTIELFVKTNNLLFKTVETFIKNT